MYRFYNRNPEKIIEEDCVCRAISTALGIRYHAADRLLDLIAEQEGCDKLCVCCYHRLLEDIFGLKVRYCYFEETVRDIALDHPNEKVIIRVDGHLTCSVMGAVLDIWDCSDEPVDCFWIV